MTLMRRSKFRLWFAREDGAAAVELALVAPMLAIVVAGIAAYAPELAVVHAMRDAVSTGAQYVMTGGTDQTNIQTVTTSAWSGKLAADTVTVTQWCSCSGVQSVCTSLCADSSVPTGWTQISAATTYASPTGDKALSATQIIRTR